MSRLRYAGLTGSIGSSGLTNSVTSHTFAAPLTYANGVTVPTLSGTDYFLLSILSSTGGLSEVVKVTAYNSGTGAATIVRGQEGTIGVAHSSGDRVTLGVYASDLTAPTPTVVSSSSGYSPSGSPVIVNLPPAGLQAGDLLAFFVMSDYNWNSPTLNLGGWDLDILALTTGSFMNIGVGVRTSLGAADQGKAISLGFSNASSKVSWHLLQIRDWGFIRAFTAGSNHSSTSAYQNWPISTDGFDSKPKAGDLVVAAAGMNRAATSVSIANMPTIDQQRAADAGSGSVSAHMTWPGSPTQQDYLNFSANSSGSSSGVVGAALAISG